MNGKLNFEIFFLNYKYRAEFRNVPRMLIRSKNQIKKQSTGVNIWSWSLRVDLDPTKTHILDLPHFSRSIDSRQKPISMHNSCLDFSFLVDLDLSSGENKLDLDLRILQGDLCLDLSAPGNSPSSNRAIRLSTLSSLSAIPNSSHNWESFNHLRKILCFKVI